HRVAATKKVVHATEVAATRATLAADDPSKVAQVVADHRRKRTKEHCRNQVAPLALSHGLACIYVQYFYVHGVFHEMETRTLRTLKGGGRNFVSAIRVVDGGAPR